MFGQIKISSTNKINFQPRWDVQKHIKSKKYFTKRKTKNAIEIALSKYSTKKNKKCGQQITRKIFIL